MTVDRPVVGIKAEALKPLLTGMGFNENRVDAALAVLLELAAMPIVQASVSKLAGGLESDVPTVPSAGALTPETLQVQPLPAQGLRPAAGVHQPSHDGIHRADVRQTLPQAGCRDGDQAAGSGYQDTGATAPVQDGTMLRVGYLSMGRQQHTTEVSQIDSPDLGESLAKGKL
jgi:hypothetical protein